MQTRIYSALVLTMLLWGGTFIAGRLLADVVSSPVAAFLRFVIASISLTLFAILTREQFILPTKKQLVGVLLLGATGIFSYNLFFFSGLHHISAGRAALIIATTPLTISILDTIIYKEKLTLWKICGIVMSFAGALFVISNGHPELLLQKGFGPGELMLLGCVLSWAAYTIIGKKLLSSMSPLISVLYSSAAGSIMLLLPAYIYGLTNQVPTLSLQTWATIGYLGFLGTAVGFCLYYWAITQIGPTRAGVFINMVPLFGLVLGWLILGERIKFSVIVGGILVLLGVSITNRVKTKVPLLQKAKDKDPR